MVSLWVISNGLIIQWHRTTFSGTGGASGEFVFPIAFTTQYTNIGYSEGYGSYIVDQGITDGRSLTKCKWALYTPASNNSSSAYNIISIGY